MYKKYCVTFTVEGYFEENFNQKEKGTKVS